MMKTKHLLALIVGLAALASACEQQPPDTVLSGRLPELSNATLSLVPVEEYFPGLTPYKEQLVSQTDSTGRFSFRFQQEEAGYYQVLRSGYPQLAYDIFLEAGDSLDIEQASWNEAPKLKISGRGSEKLGYLLTDYRLFPKDKAFYEHIRSSAFASEMAFKVFVDSLHDARIAALRGGSITAAPLQSRFLKDVNAERTRFLLEHLERRNYYLRGEFDYFFPEADYYIGLDSLGFEGAFCESTAFKQLAGIHLTNAARRALKEASEEQWEETHLSWRFNYIASRQASQWTDLLALSTLGEYSFGLMRKGFFEQVAAFEQAMDTLFYLDAHRRLFQANLRPYLALAPGEPAPDFELPDSSGTGHRLSDYKGKIVYMDFWGTWCPPCIQEVPDALALQEKYKNEPVVFLYIALEYGEPQIANWKKFIAGQDERLGELLNHRPFPGLHLVAEKQFRNAAIEPYKLNFAPTHVLIDHNGNIVNARAKRSKDISEDIDRLLEAMRAE